VPRCLQFSQDGKWLLHARSAKDVSVYSTEDWKVKRVLRLVPPEEES
jgi:hypothetical protein